MRISGGDLERARAVTEDLLEEMGLEAYLYEVEPREEKWEIRVECALSQGWQRSELAVERERLLAAFHQPETRQALLAEWGRELAECLKGA